jgi:rfaE bifunctional protein nucleotidyltransferase chain/domain
MKWLVVSGKYGYYTENHKEDTEVHRGRDMSCFEKIITLGKFQELKSQGYFKDKKIVFTNGCFDIIHSGHVLYLEEAASLGDILILGLNSDSSVKKLKGDTRPINNQHDRAVVLAGLSAVSFIIIFDENTPYNLIKSVIPNVLVKGGDWAVEDIVGHDIVGQSGGEVKSLLFKEGQSTTSIINKIGSGGACLRP